MKEEKSPEIAALLSVDDADEPEQTGRLDRVMRRVRAGVGQRDSLLFAIVKFWTVVAELLAPIFAQLAARRAGAIPAAKTVENAETNKPNPRKPSKSQ